MVHGSNPNDKKEVLGSGIKNRFLAQMDDDKPKENGGAKKKVSLKLDDIYEPIVAKVSTTALLYSTLCRLTMSYHVG